MREMEGAETRENLLTQKIIGAAIEVHRHLGPGLLASVYEECLFYELSQLDLNFQRQVHLPIPYKGLKLEGAFKMDLMVEDAVVVEIKATEGTPLIQAGAPLARNISAPSMIEPAGLRAPESLPETPRLPSRLSVSASKEPH